jgi:hypothetical protein
MSDNRTLTARIKAREKQVPAGGHVFTIRRPKAAEMALRDWTRIGLVRFFVVGWDLQNSDLMPGGTPDAEPFDAELWADFVEDRQDLWQPLSDAIMAEWASFCDRQQAAEKN